MLSLLLKFWFPIFGMFFAAGATIDLGGGGDDGGSDGSVADSGSDGTASSDDSDDQGGGADSEDESAGVTGEADQGAEGDDTADPDAPVDLGDGRQVPGKIKKLFDLAKKAGVGKEARQLYFAQQRLAKAIPGGVNGAIQLAQDIEQLGGLEAIEQLQSDAQVYQADAEAFENNPAKWVETGFQENPDAALKSFAHSLDYVADHHPEHYDHYMAKVIVNDLANLDVRGIWGVLSAIKDNPEAQKLAKQLADYYNARLETSKQAPTKKADAQSKTLSDKEAALNKKEMDLRYSQVNAKVVPALRSQIGTALQREAKAAGIDLKKIAADYPGEYQDFIQKVHKAVNRMAMKDNRFLDKHYALVQKGQLDRAEKAINDKHTALVPEAVREVMQTSGLFRGKKKGNAAAGDKGAQGDKGNANAGQNQGWTKIAKRPENSLINWAKTTSGMQLDGKYILKDGKKVIVQY